MITTLACDCVQSIAHKYTQKGSSSQVDRHPSVSPSFAHPGSFRRNLCCMSECLSIVSSDRSFSPFQYINSNLKINTLPVTPTNRDPTIFLPTRSILLVDSRLSVRPPDPDRLLLLLTNHIAVDTHTLSLSRSRCKSGQHSRYPNLVTWPWWLACASRLITFSYRRIRQSPIGRIVSVSSYHRQDQEIFMQNDLFTNK